MQRIERGVYLAHIRIRHKITAVDIIFIPCTFKEHCLQVAEQVFLKLLIIVKPYPSEADLHILVTHGLMQIQVQRGKWFQDIQLLPDFILLLVQKLLLLL